MVGPPAGRHADAAGSAAGSADRPLVGRMDFRQPARPPTGAGAPALRLLFAPGGALVPRCGPPSPRRVVGLRRALPPRRGPPPAGHGRATPLTQSAALESA